jgi:hypothetical protein
MTLEKPFDRYQEQLPTGALESNTLVTLATHKKHIVKLLGDKFAVTDADGGDLQTRYINRRAKDTWAGRPIRANIIERRSPRSSVVELGGTAGEVGRPGTDQGAQVRQGQGATARVERRHLYYSSVDWAEN